MTNKDLKSAGCYLISFGSAQNIIKEDGISGRYTS